MATFSGRKSISLDEKNRIRIPACYADALGKKFVLAKGSNGCLLVLSAEYYLEFSKPFQDIPYSDLEGRKIARKFFANIDTPDEDTQGRFVIPQFLRDFAGINKKIVFIGVGNMLEIWSEERLEEENVDGDIQEFDEYYARMSKYGL